MSGARRYFKRTWNELLVIVVLCLMAVAVGLICLGWLGAYARLQSETQALAPKAQTYPAPTTLRECLDWYAAIDYACAEVALPDDLHDMDL